MIISKRRVPRLAILSALAGLVAWWTLWLGSPVLAQTFAFEKIQTRYQTIQVRDAEGNLLGSGDFRASISSNRHGRVNGRAELQMPDFTIEIEFTGVDEILYEAGNPVGVVLNGRGTLLREGQIQTFPATATVRGGGTTTIPDCLIWDIPEPAVLDGLNFEAEGTMRFRE